MSLLVFAVLLGGFFGLGMPVRGLSGFRRPPTWSIEGLDDGWHSYLWPVLFPVAGPNFELCGTVYVR